MDDDCGSDIGEGVSAGSFERRIVRCEMVSCGLLLAAVAITTRPTANRMAARAITCVRAHATGAVVGVVKRTL